MLTDTEFELVRIKQALTQSIQEVHYLKNRINGLREHLKGVEAKNQELRQLMLDAPLLERQIRDLKLELTKRDFLIAELRSYVGNK